jgi:DNA-directed RNA polymerase subunit RPC12/RpoP
MLSEYDFDEDNNLILCGESLDSMYERAWYEFRKKQDIEHERRVKQQEEAEAERKRRQEEAEAERKRKQEEQQRLKEEYERKQREYQEEQKRLKEAAEAEKRKAAEEFARNMAAGFEQQETQIKDENGVRWIKCEFCGKIAPVKEFSSYGGANHINLGTCIECSRNNPAAAVEIKIPQRTKQRYDSNICPECGSRLIERNGRNGRFMGCSGYPRCRYTRSIR